MFGRNPFARFLSFLHKLGSFRKPYRRSRVHNYTSYKCGRDYAFDEVENGFQAYMTAYGRGIKRGDLIVLLHERGKIRYRIEQIDYYANPSDLWIALLIRDQ
jgi:MioC protein